MSTLEILRPEEVVLRSRDQASGRFPGLRSRSGTAVERVGRVRRPMPNNLFHCVSHWRVQATMETVYEILLDAQDLACWWPSVYLQAEQLDLADASGVGKHAPLYGKGPAAVHIPVGVHLHPDGRAARVQFDPGGMESDGNSGVDAW